MFQEPSFRNDVPRLIVHLEWRGFLWPSRVVAVEPIETGLGRDTSGVLAAVMEVSFFRMSVPHNSSVRSKPYASFALLRISIGYERSLQYSSP